MAASNGLPSFNAPPIAEAIFSIQFAPIPALRGAHVGQIWEAFRDVLPKTSEQPPINAMFETFGGPNLANMQQAIHFGIPPTRYWFTSQGDDFLLQIQEDRIIFNWRRQSADSKYPGYVVLKSLFERYVLDITKYLKNNSLGVLAPNQCEATYINAIELPGGIDPHVNLDKVTNLYKEGVSDQLGGLEASTLQIRRVIEVGGKPVARNYITFSPGFLQNDLKPIIQLEVTSRGAPAAQNLAGAWEFLDLAHASVVRTFDAVTNPELHRMWEKVNG